MAESNEIELAADIISAYVRKNAVRPADLPDLIAEVHGALVRVSAGAVPVVVEAQKPAVPIKKSVLPDFIICLEDGKKFKSLKRHLSTSYDMTPEAYPVDSGCSPRLFRLPGRACSPHRTRKAWATLSCDGGFNQPPAEARSSARPTMTTT
jgi:hypothetical protein